MATPTFREMARALGIESTPEDGDPECGCLYCATGGLGWCSSRPMPMEIPRFRIGDRISFSRLEPIGSSARVTSVSLPITEEA